MTERYIEDDWQEPYDLITTHYRVHATTYCEVLDGERIKTFDDYDKAVRFARSVTDREKSQ